MNHINEFWDLDAWKIGNDFVIHIYTISKCFPRDEQFGLTSQIRRSSASITANIAEGFSRFSFKDKNRFYYNARGSLSETQNHLLLAQSIGYINKDDCEKLINIASRIKQIINGLIRSTSKAQ